MPLRTCRSKKRSNKALLTYGCHAYLPEDRYRQKRGEGRILPQDLAAELVDELGDDADHLIGYLGTRFHLRLAMLQHPLRQGPDAELRWLLAETDALAQVSQRGSARTSANK